MSFPYEDDNEKFKRTLASLFTFEDYNSAIWEIGVKGINERQQYCKQLHSIMRRLDSNSDITLLLKEWSIKDSDLETYNNFQRFHLFLEVLKENHSGHQKILRLIEAWIDNHPPTRTDAWNSFNCAIRLINWLKLLWFIPLNSFPSGKSWRKIQFSMFKQTVHICRNIEYHIPGNHVVFQFFILWLMSMVFPTWRKAHRLLRQSETKVIEELQVEFLENGFHFEQSFHYHIQVILVGLFWVYGTSRTGKVPEASTKSKLRKAFNLINKFILPDRSIPMLGDNCYSFFHEQLSQDVDNALKLGSNIFPKLIQNKERNDIEDLRNQFVIGSIDNSKLIVDVGNIGLRCNPGHGHSDILSFLYCSNGICIFTDPGTRRYSNNPDDLILKKTVSHNILSIDGADQAKLWGFFRWGFLPNHVSYTIKLMQGHIVVKGQYFGFKHIGGFIHSRMISMTPDTLTIDDSVQGGGSHTIYVNFILDSSVKVEHDKQLIKLLVEHRMWIVDIEADIKPQVSIVPIFCYKDYDLSIPTNKIELGFRNVELPFHSIVRVILKR